MFYFWIDNNKINGKSDLLQDKVWTDDRFQVEVTEEIYNDDIAKYIWNGENIVLDSDYEEKQKEKEEEEFNRKFFNTSLGYVSRDVHMKNGAVKDFLTDILPLLKVGIPVLVYTRELVQSKVPATQQFIDECGQQLIKDFYGEN